MQNHSSMKAKELNYVHIQRVCFQINVRKALTTNIIKQCDTKATKVTVITHQFNQNTTYNLQKRNALNQKNCYQW